ncbi:MAG: SufS family cysteine desulfurase [Bacteroidota bacterium]
MNPTAGAQEFDINALRKQFPILDQQVNGHPLVYFDNAATTQKPQRVIDRLVDYYHHDNANIHRGIHTLAERATKGFEDTRKSVAAFINAPSAEEIVITRGVTEGIKHVAASYGKQYIKKGDEILISGLEHHINIVPWQILCEEKGATLRVINVLEDGTLDLDDFRSRLKKGKTKLVSVNHASNSLGTINPIEDIIREAHYADAAVLIDGAQGVAHLPVDVTALGCDFYVASGHKMYGPTGVGFLYGKRSWLEKMPPWQSGGEMIAQVTFEKTTWNKIPYKFEAGTPNIADVTALGEAIAFIQSEGKEKLAAHEHALLTYASEKMKSVDGIRFYGTALQKVSVISFLMDGFHPFDIGQMLDARGIAVRTGHHCTQPLMDHFRIVGTVRASFAAYNTFEEVDKLVEALKRLEKLRS